MDGFCDNADERFPSCLGEADCWDCDPCQAFSYSCSACERRPNCHWCAGDAICSSQPLGADFWADQAKQSACPAVEDWQQNCNTAAEDDVFGDVLYAASKWIYRLINVESVWREDITGRGVQIRVNDDGVDPWHPDFISKFDYGFSCDDGEYAPANQQLDKRGTAMAAIAAADNNGACSVGIAPGATLNSCTVLQPEDAAFVWNTQLKEGGIGVDISLNGNWGKTGCEQIPDTRQQSTDADADTDTDTVTATCIFDVDHPYSPCNYCPTDPALFATSADQHPLCQKSIVLFCRNYFEVNPLQCTNYLDWFATCNYHQLDDNSQQVLVENIVAGRRGLGVVFVVPAGDDYRLGGDGNFNGMVHSRFTMAVGAIGKDGIHASYSTPGAPLWIAAPGGDLDYVSNNIVAQPGGGCTEAGAGTSYAASVVAGVVALMLEVAPELGWRDVLAILAKSANHTALYNSEDNDNDGDWTTNGAGYAHSYKYGFGIVNAAAAVNMSRTWNNFRTEEQILVESNFDEQEPPLIIADDANNATTSTLSIGGLINPFFRIESVIVYLELKHSSRGDLKITLTSPAGTESVLAPSKRPQGEEDDNAGSTWQFLTVRNFWEYPGGDWTLSIADELQGKLLECIDYDFEYSYSMGEGEDAQQETILCTDFDHVTTTCTNQSEVDPVLLEAEFQGLTILESCCSCGGGRTVNETVPNELLSWKMVVYGHVAADASGSTDLLYVPESTCQFSNDTCTRSWQFDHQCDDNLLNEQCIGQDCFDCDACQVFNYDCGACTRAGCHWCPGDGMCMSVQLNQSFWALYPEKVPTCPTTDDWVSTCDARRPENSFDDPLYETMAWSYEMINVEEAWNRKASGAGIHVRINDDGVDADHPEFASNFDRVNSCQFYAPWDNEKDTHGTAVASIVAGNSNNDECAVGIAPGATISSCVGPNRLDEAADLLLENLDTVHISQNSWGPNVCKLKEYGRGRRLQQCLFSTEHPDSPCEVCGSFTALDELTDECETAVTEYCMDNYEEDLVACSEFLDLFIACEYHMLPLDTHEAFVRAITEGRNGLGIIFVFSTGNSWGEDVNFNGFANSRFTIAVGAVGKDKKHASYSTKGAATFISAPGADYESISANIVAKPGGGCHDIGVGTSFAAPIVSGVVALMLQVNSRLGWRDVQGILALTSQRIDPTNPSWVTNAAGYNHSYQYGFGLVDTVAAMNRASVWENFRTEKRLMVESGNINKPIEDSPSLSDTTSSLTITEATSANFVTESVVVYLDVQHPSRGDILVTLTSPKGTESILHPSKRPEDTQLYGEDRGKWKLLSLRTWGEYPTGDWTLSLKDERPGYHSECHDLPWEFSYPRSDGQGNETLKCKDFEEVTDCNDEEQLNPSILTEVYQNLTLAESCCRCGGGQKSTDIVPVLRSWKLVVYGHIIESLHELLILPPSPTDSGGTQGGTTTGGGNGSDTTGSSSGSSPDNIRNGTENQAIAGWDDEGNSGVFKGGGGTAYYSGWRKGDNNDRYGEGGNNGGGGSSSKGRSWKSLEFCTAWMIALILNLWKG